MLPLLSIAILTAQGARDPIAKATAGLQERAGPFTAWVGGDRVLVQLPADDGDLGGMLLATALPAGLGSNPVGLDRGQLGRTRHVTFAHAGDRVLLEQHNTGHRADSDNPAEAQAVRESFAISVLASLPVVATSPDAVLVDATAFLSTDLHGVADRLRASEQGSFTVDAERSRVLADRTLGFDDNLAFFARVTFAGTDAGGEVASVTPDPRSLTLDLAQLWVALPDDGYTPKAFDPRGGFFGPSYLEHASPPGAPLVRQWIARHRRGDGPLIYYVDSGAPEPVRQALVDGAEWWAEAFANAGMRGEFQVQVLPDDASPYDASINVIQWVHRATRGWSYGDAILDPRSGEIVKGHVTLGSQRVRHDRLLFEALLGADRTGTGADDDPEQLALARLRQLSAHEVGHTLGLMHNFAASSDGRASVMDYPAPWLRVVDGDIDTSRAYAVGVGPWDIAAIGWGYGDRPIDDVAKLPYVTDRDARPMGAANPRGHLWDNGADPVAELQRLLQVRAVALERFGQDRIAAGRPLSDLQDAFSLVYLLHRYQLQAAARQLGGLHYRYAVRGDAEPRATPVDAATQRQALSAVLGTLDALVIDDATVALLLPAAPGAAIERERLAGRANSFDPLAAAGTAAALALEPLLDPQRLARLHRQHRADRQVPSPGGVIDAVIAKARSVADPDVALQVLHATAVALMRLSADEQAAPHVRAVVDQRLAAWVARSPRSAGERLVAQMIRRHLARPAAPAPAASGSLPAPPGPPIGM
ncbi:MAG: zinc-dependent metalloprotease [Myxococcales bacterium]|nr:zinc-dependent metalloprotease [Myxococcales bacterium]